MIVGSCLVLGSAIGPAVGRIPGRAARLSGLVLGPGRRRRGRHLDRRRPCVPETLKTHDELDRRRPQSTRWPSRPTSRPRHDLVFLKPPPSLQEARKVSPCHVTIPAPGLDPVGLDDLRPDVPGAGDRQGSRPEDRPIGDRPGRRGRDARLRCALEPAPRRGEGGRLRDVDPAVRDDGRRGLPPPGSGSSPWRPSGSPQRFASSPGTPAGGDDRALGRALGVPGQRRGLCRAHAPGPRPDPALKRPPIPYLVGLATASNVGSVATITGNPQNIIIGSLSQISYLRFAYQTGARGGDWAGAHLSSSSALVYKGDTRADSRQGLARGPCPSLASTGGCWSRASCRDPGDGRALLRRVPRSPWWPWERRRVLLLGIGSGPRRFTSRSTGRSW